MRISLQLKWSKYCYLVAGTVANQVNKENKEESFENKEDQESCKK